ncbi:MULTISPECIES: transposase family protein [Moraxella]
MITLKYYKEYHSQFHIAQDFGITKSTVCKAIK